MRNTQRTSVGWSDVRNSIERLPAAIYIGVSDVEARYRRTIIGPIWLVISHGLWVLALGAINIIWFKADFKSHLVFLSAGLPVWAMLIGSVTDGPTSLERGRSLSDGLGLPYAMFAVSRSIEYLLVFSHQFLIYLICIFWSGTPVLPVALLALPAMVIIFVFTVGMNLLTGVLGARYRDIRPAANSFAGVAFVVTPVFWAVNSADVRSPFIAFNPLYHLIEIVRDPLTGNLPSMMNYVFSITSAMLVFCAGMILFIHQRVNLRNWIG